jgi:hypothetical protein
VPRPPLTVSAAKGGLLICVVLALLLVATSSRGENEDAEAAAQSTLGTQEARAAKEVPPERRRRRRRLLKRRDAPPTGVRRQITYFETGNGGCVGGARPIPDTPSIYYTSKPFYRDPRTLKPADLDEVAIGELFSICIAGFDFRRPLTASVTRPDGTQVVNSFRRQRKFSILAQEWSFTVLPGDPVGVYQARAYQGALDARGSFTVTPPIGPGIRVENIGDRVLPRPGDSFRIIGSGLPPREKIRIHLYHKRPKEGRGRYRFITALRLRTDTNGGLFYKIKSYRGDPKGCYVIRPAIKAETYDENFCLF